MVRTVLLIAVLLIANLAQLRGDSCWKDCGCGYTLDIYHRWCDWYGDCACHVSDCLYHSFSTGYACWDPMDKFDDRCSYMSEGCQCDSVWQHQCGSC
jgi:hypothetical protein